MISLKDVWLAFILAMIRFWDNRFQHQEDEALAILRIELDKAHYQNKLLIEALTAKQDLKTAEEINEELPKPLSIPKWQARANKLTQDSIKRRRELEKEYEAAQLLKKSQEAKPEIKVQARTVEELEVELGVGAD